MPYEGGFQGRTNKLVDGCYSFWQGGVYPLLESVLDEAEEWKTDLRSHLFDRGTTSHSLSWKWSYDNNVLQPPYSTSFCYVHKTRATSMEDSVIDRKTAPTTITPAIVSVDCHHHNIRWAYLRNHLSLPNVRTARTWWL